MKANPKIKTNKQKKKKGKNIPTQHNQTPKSNSLESSHKEKEKNIRFNDKYTFHIVKQF